MILTSISDGLTRTGVDLRRAIAALPVGTMTSGLASPFLLSTPRTAAVRGEASDSLKRRYLTSHTPLFRALGRRRCGMRRRNRYPRRILLHSTLLRSKNVMREHYQRHGRFQCEWLLALNNGISRTWLSSSTNLENSGHNYQSKRGLDDGAKRLLRLRCFGRKLS